MYTDNDIRLVQLSSGSDRKVALVREPHLLLLEETTSIYRLALTAIARRQNLKALVLSLPSAGTLDYSAVYEGNSNWKILPSFDHPEIPSNCLVTGTGLTHKNSALNRQVMHQHADDKPTDSMRMYRWGLEGGSPASGEIGTQPEWFYKGSGAMLKAHGEKLDVPPYADDGGEEPELAGLYVVDEEGTPWRVGFSAGNEFSDHVMEKKNYLYLAPSKLRTCSLGPEVLVGSGFEQFTGEATVTRQGATIWNSVIKSGEANMAHNLQNIEHHHFKYAAHRVALQAHVHFFGADAFSFGAGVKLQDGDAMQVQWEGLGRPLVNYVSINQEEDRLITVKNL
jgi:hypothetical protein